MVHLSGLFIAVFGSSLVSAQLDGVTSGIQGLLAHLNETSMPVDWFREVTVHYTEHSQLKKDGIVSIDFDINLMPVPVEVTFDSFATLGVRHNTTYLSVDNTTLSTPIIAPTFTTRNSGSIYNVKVVNDLQPIVESGFIDLMTGALKSRIVTLDGTGGLPTTLTLRDFNIPIKFIQDVDD